MDRENILFEKFAKILLDSGIENKFINEAESYILGETDTLSEDFPSKIFDRNKKPLSWIDFFTEIDRRYKYSERDLFYGRYFDVVFQIGKSSAIETLPYYAYEKIPSFNIAPEKKAILYAERFCFSENYFDYSLITNLIKIVNGDTDALVKAIKYNIFNRDNALLFIYSAYFRIKKENDKNYAKNIRQLIGKDESGILDTIKKILNIGDSTDIKLLADYEEAIISSVFNLFETDDKDEDIKKVSDYLKENTRKERITDSNLLSVIKKSPYSRYLVNLLGGFSFLNYTLSDKLYNMVNICLEKDKTTTIDVIYRFAKDSDELIKFSEDFHIPPVDIIMTLADISANKVKKIEALKTFAQRFPDELKSALVNASLNQYIRLFESYSEVSPEKANIISKQLNEKLTEKIAYSFTLSDLGNDKNLAIVKYLKGETSLNTLDGISFSAPWDWRVSILNCKKLMGFESDMFKRVIALSFAIGLNYVTAPSIIGNEENLKVANRIQKAFQYACNEGVSFKQILDACFVLLNTYTVKPTVSEILSQYYDKAPDEVFSDSLTAPTMIRVLILDILKIKAPERLLDFFADTSKAVNEKLIDVVSEIKELEPKVIEKLSSKKSSERATAVAVLAKYDKTKYTALFNDLFEKEKTQKIKGILSAYLGLANESPSSKTVTAQKLVNANTKKALLWATENNIIVHDNDGNDSQELALAILASFSKMSPLGINETASKLAENLNKKELAVFISNVFERWLELGATAKNKWVLYACSIFGSEMIIPKLKHNINEWPKVSRGAIAAEAVQALALNGSATALMEVDAISRKFKFKQVKESAGKALLFTANQLGISPEELADKIVPTLGFDKEMHRVFDYGTRKFDVYLNAVPEIEVYDEKGKKLKTLPSPAKKDDEVTAKESYESFKLMKKQIKTVIETQKSRLENAVSFSRKWKTADWKKLFIENPVMHSFAISLIWGVYKDDKLTDTFRYMEDGSFNTVDEEEYELEGNCLIGLIHPIEIGEETKNSWLEQLSDYEITQSVTQLERKVCKATEEEKNAENLERFGGKVINILSLWGKLSGMGWYKGSVLDAGIYYTFYREDTKLGIGVELNFSGSYVGDGSENVTVYNAVFYKDTVNRGSYVYDKVKKENIIKLGDVPEIYFSEIVAQLEKATSSSTETNSSWKEDAHI